MVKMLKKITAIVLVMAAAALCLAGCSKKYVMTEEDLKIQKQIEGFWAADVSTGLNEFDEDGNLVMAVIVEFTEDFHYILHMVYMQENYTGNYEPVAYSFENGDFKTIREDVAYYAKISISEDGQTLFWTTDEKTESYRRIDDELLKQLENEHGLVAYDPNAVTESIEIGGDDETENTEGIESTESGE